MAVTQGNTPQAQEIRFSPKNRLKLTTPETEYIYNEAVAPLAGAYQYYELVPGGGTSGVVYRFPPGTDFEALEKFEETHPDIQVTFRTGRPAPPNAAYAEPMKVGMPRSTSTELQIRTPQYAPNPTPSMGSPSVIEIGPPFKFKSDLPDPVPTYGRGKKIDREVEIQNVLDYTLETYGAAPSMPEAKKKLKAFGNPGVPFPDWVWDRKHENKIRNPFLTYIPKPDPDTRVQQIRYGDLKATLVNKQAAEAARRNGLGVWQLGDELVGKFSGSENQFLIYPSGDTKKRDEVLGILEAYPLGYRGRQYFQEMGRAMGVPDNLTEYFTETFYQNPTILPEGVTPAKAESPKWLGLIAVAAIAFLFFKKPAQAPPTQGV